MRVAVIMAGGSGERFWPLSRKSKPKQLLRLTDSNRTMLQEAVDRIAPLVGKENVYIATAGHLYHAINEAKIVSENNIFAEPDNRNTLGGLAWTVAHFQAKQTEPVTMAVLTADHKISNEVAFRSDLSLAFAEAESQGSLGTIGIVPTRAETGYGYIELASATSAPCYKVRGFKEKPNIETATEFLNSGKFLWNSGMFIWNVETFQNELKKVSPETSQIIESITQAIVNDDLKLAEDEFRKLPKLSIDYALMEHASHVFCIKSTFEWDDVGAFDALLRTMPVDSLGNVIIGNVAAIDCANCVLYNESSTAVLTAVGLQNQLLVQTKDAVLGAKLDDAQRVKEIVSLLKETSFI